MFSQIANHRETVRTYIQYYGRWRGRPHQTHPAVVPFKSWFSRRSPTTRAMPEQRSGDRFPFYYVNCVPVAIRLPAGDVGRVDGFDVRISAQAGGRMIRGENGQVRRQGSSRPVISGWGRRVCRSRLLLARRGAGIATPAAADLACMMLDRSMR